MLDYTGEILSSTATVRHGCFLLTSLILHNVATSPDDARRKEINRVCYHFNCFLNRANTHGLVLVDRFEDKQIDAHLREKFSVGVTGLPYSPELRLERIVGFHYSAIGQSHFGSIVDIALGSLRFAINAFARDDAQRLPTARLLLGLLSPLFLRENDRGNVSELSIFFSPKVIKVDRYRAIYEGVKTFFAESGITTDQQITDVRTY